VAPAILGEFSHEDLGFTVGSPTAIPMLRCQLKADCTTDWEMDWYLAFPGGPHGPDNDVTKPRWALNGKSDQTASLFVLPLGGTQDTDGLDYVGSYTAADASQFTISAGDSTAYPDLDYSFFSDVIAVDYDLDFKTDSLYFGSVASANLDETKNHTGALHRLKIADDLDPANWVLNTFYKTPGNRPVSGAPSVASDGQRAWIYFGTGRYYSAQIDKSKINDYSQQGFFGLKERYTAAGDMDLTLPNGGNLVDVSEVRVLKGSGDLQLTSGTLPLETTGGDSLTGVDTFAKLNEEMSAKYDTAPDTGLDKYHGWMLDFDLVGERNLGQAAILGNIVTFTSYVPESNICSPEGNSYLWAPFYRTGTAYFKPVMGSIDLGDDTAESLRKVSIGVGLASTPNIHSGGEDGSKAFVQTSTGAIISIEQDNPGVVKSGVVSWREIGD
jgi:type IV pilus assembly protein PilY1